MSGLEFQLDDFEQVAAAADPSIPAVLLGVDTPETSVLRGHPTMVKFFRPVLHFSFVCDAWIFGVSASAYHSMSIFWHALAAVLLFAAVRRLTASHDTSLATAVAFCFAVHPGKWGAVSWIAARGDILSTVGTLAAVLSLAAYRERPGRWLFFSLFFWVFFSLFAKEGGLVAPLILAATDLLVLRRNSVDRSFWPRLRVLIPLLLIVPAYLIFRRVFFGPNANFYAGAARVMNFEVLLRMFSDIPSTFTRLLAGYFHFEEESWRAKAAALFTKIVIAANIAWVARRPVRRGILLLVTLLFYGLTLIPVLRLYREASGFDASRLFYLPGTLAATFLVLPLGSLKSPFRWLRLGTWMYAGLVVGMSLISALEHIQANRGAARIIARVRQDVQAFSEAQNKPDLAYLVMNVPTAYRHAPTYGTFMTFAFRPPFMQRPLAVRAVMDLDIYLANREMQSSRAAIQALEWVDDVLDGGRLRPMTGYLPVPRGYRPVIPVSEGMTQIPINPPLAPRDIDVIEIHFAEAPKSPFDLTLVFTDDQSRSFRVPIRYDPGLGTTSRLRIPLNDHLPKHAENPVTWYLLGSIVRLDLEFGSGARPVISSFVTAGELEVMEALSPAADAVIPAKGEEPTFIFTDLQDTSVFRFRLTSPPLTWTLPRERLLRIDENRLGFRLSMRGIREGELPRYWADLTNQVNVISQGGVAELPLYWFVEGLRANLDYAQSRTRVLQVLIRP